MRIVKDGVEQTISVHWRDHWKVIFLPVFPPPAFIDGRPYTEGIFSNRAEVMNISEDPREIAKRHNADDVIHTMPNPLRVATSYSQLVAKIGYGLAVERLGLGGIAEAFVVPGILGQRNDLGRWVGCDGQKTIPAKNITSG